MRVVFIDAITDVISSEANTVCVEIRMLQRDYPRFVESTTRSILTTAVVIANNKCSRRADCDDECEWLPKPLISIVLTHEQRIRQSM